MPWLRFITLVLSGLLMGCSTASTERRPDCTEIRVRYAEGFKLKKCTGGFELNLTNGESFWLDSDANSTDSHFAGLQISVPVERVVCTSTTQLPWFTELGVSDIISGFTFPERMYSPELRTKLAEGRLKPVSRAGGLDEEAIFLLGPDLLLADQGVALSSRLTERIPVLRTAEFAEPHPLGRAEWIRLAGILTGRTAQADSIFLMVEENYQRLRSDRPSDYAPSVLTGIPYGGIWYMPAAGSFMTRFFMDAGFRYPFSEMAGVSTPLGLETVVVKDPSFDIWIGTGHWASVQDAIASDPRLNAITAVQEGKMYAYDALTTPGGGNAYFEEAVVRPDLLLQDLINIRLQRYDRLRYYRKLPD